MDLGLAGKTVVITGATANIGRRVALGMAAEGANVVAVGRDQAAGARLVEQAKAAGAADAIFVAVDLLEPDAGERIAAAAMERFGGVDVLVNGAAGNNAAGMFAESDPESWSRDVEINFMQVLRVTRAILPQMIAANTGGRIINIGSGAAFSGDPLLSIYSAAKGAVHTFTRVLAKEVGQYEITVNCVSPGATLPEGTEDASSGSRWNRETGFLATTFRNMERPERFKSLQKSGPLTRPFGKPGEVASAVVYLASEQAAYITGQIVCVDGGTLL